jgi:hypothetical protein
MSERSGFDYPAGGASTVDLLIIAADPANREVASGAAMIVGVREVSGSVSAQLSGGSIDIVIADIRGCDDESAGGLLAEIDLAARASPLRVIVALDDAQIDIAAAGVFGPHVQHLCRPTIIDFATALSAAKVAPERRARDPGRDADRLRRVTEEIARIADALLSIAREGGIGGGDDAAAQVRDARPGFGAPPPAGVDAAAIDGGVTVSASDVRGAIRARRLRAQYFDAELFADPAWDMLLDLFAATLEGARVSVSSLCIAAAVPGTTALRWIGTMMDAELLVREADPRDRRRAYVALRPAAAAAMAAYFGAVKRQAPAGA